MRLQAEIAPGLSVLANEELLEEIVENLLENALGFAADQGHITVRADARERQVALEVSDDGPGVPDERMARIFDRYFSDRSQCASPGDRNGGHDGIGLWLVHRDAEAVGGSVTAKNGEPNGLVVTVLLPRP